MTDFVIRNTAWAANTNFIKEANHRKLDKKSLKTTDVFNSEQALQEAQEATLELISYFSDFIDARRRSPEDDLISAFVDAQAEGIQLSNDEILAFSILLLVVFIIIKIES